MTCLYCRQARGSLRLKTGREKNIINFLLSEKLVTSKRVALNNNKKKNHVFSFLRQEKNATELEILPLLAFPPFFSWMKAQSLSPYISLFFSRIKNLTVWLETTHIERAFMTVGLSLDYLSFLAQAT